MGSRRGSNEEELVSFLAAVDKFEDIDGSKAEERGGAADSREQFNTEVILMGPQLSAGASSAGSHGTCGLWCLRSRCLQRLNSFELFIVFLTLFGLCGGLQNALKSVTLTKLERRFNFDSTTSALVLMANDIVFLPSVLIISYFGSLSHRPRLLAMSCFGYGLAALTFALPHFIFGPLPASGADGMSPLQKLGYACPASANASSIGPAQTPKARDARFESSVALALFLLGGFIEGLSVAPYFNLGVAFIDDVTGDFSGVFIGLVMAAKILSPTLGYQLYGKVFIRYTDSLAPSTANDRASSAFVPAWWLGFVLVGFAAVLISIPMAMFPSRPSFNAEKYRLRQSGSGASGLLCRVALRMSARRSPRRQSQVGELGTSEKAASSFRGFLDASKRLLSNPVYVCLMCGNMFEFLEINCVIAYLVKYLELHFRISSGDAAVLAGIAGPGANVLGIILSSAIAARFTWNVPQLAKFHAIVNCFGLLAAMTGFVFVCPRLELVGGFYGKRATFVPECAVGGARVSPVSPFRAGCNCSSTAFKPICIDGRNFFSPCAANCHERGGNVSCSCVYNSTAGLSTGAFDSFPLSQLKDRVNLLCSDECSTSVYIYVAVFTLIKLVRLSARSQEAVLQLRCVRAKDKALGLGVTSFMFSLGGIWVPAFVGYLFDQACIFYDPRPSFRRTCQFFDTQRFRYSFVGFSTAALVPACAFFCLAWLFTIRDPKFSAAASPDAEDFSSHRGTVELLQPAGPEAQKPQQL